MNFLKGVDEKSERGDEDLEGRKATKGSSRADRSQDHFAWGERDCEVRGFHSRGKQ